MIFGPKADGEEFRTADFRAVSRTFPSRGSCSTFVAGAVLALQHYQLMSERGMLCFQAGSST
jgi:hypothetical protein